MTLRDKLDMENHAMSRVPRHIRDEANDNPEKANGPADGVVAANTIPIEYQG